MKITPATMRKDFAGVRRAIAATPLAARGEMRSKALQALATNIIARPARQITPKDTGTLRRSVRIRSNKARDKLIAEYGSKKAWYGSFLEFGFTDRGGVKVVKYKKLFRRSVNRNIPEFYSRATELLGKKVADDLRVRIKGVGGR